MPAIAWGRSTGAIELEVAPFDTKVVPHTLEVVSFDLTVAPSPSTLLPLAFVPSRVPPRLTRSIWKKESGPIPSEENRPWLSRLQHDSV